jgi:S-(hydroxymethyl)glutathione dehydrogenase/alcohol dehydrogenase
VRILASGLCHSDDHFAKGDISVGHLPICGGHEAAGVVEAVGPGVSTLREGDHIVTAFIPSCGHCRWCASGMQALCDNGALMLEGTQLDGTFRMHLGDEDIAQAACRRSRSTPSSRRSAASRSRPMCRRRSPRPSAALSRPAGGRRSTPPRSRPAMS